MFCLSFISLGYNSIAENLKFVRIYFDATTFDKITRDRSATFEDMLSNIGGTMGLLTGFSIISGVEIVYFSIRILFKVLEEKLSKRKRMGKNSV